MAPSMTLEDYYEILGVEQGASTEQIKSAYRRRALKLHPDRNTSPTATVAFLRLSQAYKTLEDPISRRDYDLSSKRTPAQPQSPPTAAESPAVYESVQIAAIQKTKQERQTRWSAQKHTLDIAIADLQSRIRRLQQEIESLTSIAAAEASAEAQKNSWMAWLLSPLYHRAEESDEVKARKERERQERRIERDMKQRRMRSMRIDLKKEENKLRGEMERFEAADRANTANIQTIQARARFREQQDRREKERKEAEQAERIRREQNERRMEELRKAAESIQRQARQEAEQRQRETAHIYNRYGHFASPESTRNSCRHAGWWSVVEGRTLCPHCSVVWAYLLYCPGCSERACLKCQSVMRPGRRQRPVYPYQSFDHDDW